MYNVNHLARAHGEPISLMRMSLALLSNHEISTQTVQRSLSSKVKIKIYISTNYIVEQRSDKCKKHENVKKRGIKNNKNIQE